MSSYQPTGLRRARFNDEVDDQFLGATAGSTTGDGMTYGNRCQLCGELYTGFMHTCLTPGVLNQPVYKPALPQIPVGWKCPQCQNIHAPAVLACPNCNRALGLINENSGTARALAEYLEKQI